MIGSSSRGLYAMMSSSMKNGNTYIQFGLGMLVVLLVAGAGFVGYRAFVTPMISYTNSEYSISFEYPASYVFEEGQEAGHHSIVLMDKEVAAQAPKNGEGPTAITFEIFENPRALSPLAWAKATPASNFQLSPDQMLASSTQADAESIAYVWDGLYRGESYVFEHGTRIVMASVTTLTPEDQIRKDFEKILRTLSLE